MKRTPKKLLGMFGLVLVAAMTIVAAILPVPSASAESSVTDTIVVRVLSASPDVNIDYPPDGSVFVGPEHTVTFDYANVDRVKVTLEKVVTEGQPPVVVRELFVENPMGVAGEGSSVIDLSEDGLGYGEYIIRIVGRNINPNPGPDDEIDEDGYAYIGLSDEDVVKIEYLPVSAEVEEKDDGKVITTLDYNDQSQDLDHFIITVYDGNGNPVPGMTDIIVNRPTKEVELPFGKDTPDGEYTIEVTAISTSGEEVYKKYTTIFKYETIRVPDTGGLFTSLNISRTDYLITGLGIFFVMGIAGMIFVGKRNSKR